MGFLVTAYTDIGISRASNQDSICVKRGRLNGDELVMAVICDGMGGLEKGELASAEIIRFFSDWFDRIPESGIIESWDDIPLYWSNYLEHLNQRIHDYGDANNLRIGSTFSGLLLWRQRYLLVHIGDTRIYRITDRVKRMTTDHVLPERLNILTRCIGSNNIPEPEIRTGIYGLETVFLMCTDGFWHKITEEELGNWFSPELCFSQEMMHERCVLAVNEIEERGEQDNISVILIKNVGDDDRGHIMVSSEATETVRHFEVLESLVYIHTDEKISADVWSTGGKEGFT